MDVESAGILIEEITRAAGLHVQDVIDTSSKGSLLHGRIHVNDSGEAAPEPIAFRVYLTVAAPKYRKALAAMLLADSRLADAQLRYADPRGRRKKIPRDWRLCRLCMNDVEDTLHALFVCHGSGDLVTLRGTLWQSCADANAGHNLQRLSPREAFHHMLLDARLVPILAKYSFNVLAVFEKVDMFVASEAYWW